jgi:ethanolamine ammonia-lyase large subunit
MLNYQSTSFHDQRYVRELFGLRRAPEFEAWLTRFGLTDESGRLRAEGAAVPLLSASRERAG